MPDYSRPIIGISKCLEFEMCRYDGSRINNNFVRIMKKYVDFVPTCPEVGIGLGSPIKPIRLVKIKGQKNLYQPSTKKNLTQDMHNFTIGETATTAMICCRMQIGVSWERPFDSTG